MPAPLDPGLTSELPQPSRVRIDGGRALVRNSACRPESATGRPKWNQGPACLPPSRRDWRRTRRAERKRGWRGLSLWKRTRRPQQTGQPSPHAIAAGITCPCHPQPAQPTVTLRKPLLTAIRSGGSLDCPRIRAIDRGGRFFASRRALRCCWSEIRPMVHPFRSGCCPEPDRMANHRGLGATPESYRAAPAPVKRYSGADPAPTGRAPREIPPCVASAALGNPKRMRRNGLRLLSVVLSRSIAIACTEIFVA